MIEAALKECGGKVSGAATKLGLPARMLDSKIKRYAKAPPDAYKGDACGSRGSCWGMTAFLRGEPSI